MSDAKASEGPTPKSRTSLGRPLTWIATTLVASTALFYPILVYGLLRSSTEPSSMRRLAWLLAPLGISVVWSARASGTPLVRRMAAPVSALALVALAMGLDALQPVLLLPAIVNGALLASFGSTLLQGPPLIERFARLQHPDLTPAESAWCRSWTVAWSAFFATNILVAVALVVANALQLWAFYNGLLTYIVMGLFFAGEYTVRKYRFRRYGAHPLDRLLRRIFEPHGALPHDH